MASKQLLTIFGATGNQGGSVIDTTLSHPGLKDKYALRGITRDPSSAKAQALADKGVEMVAADLNDVDSMKKAIEGSYGVFGVTDFWAVMSKDIEIQQGKNIFESCKTQGVKHFVFSALPYAERITDGVLKHVDHFDSKAIVGEYIEANKGEMIASYFMPAMFINFAKSQIRSVDGTPTLSMPFPSDSIAWPLIDPRRDGGKWVMGLFEGGPSANGVKVHAASTWTTPKEVVAAVSKEADKEVVLKLISKEVFASFLPENIREEITETMLLVGDYSYYGNGAEKQQSEHDKWLVPGAEKISFGQWVKENGPWSF
ncbi:hypothetical protein LTR85_004136 [Meristemomyces frigidus]|nr:hypothetical protein LTR85_004136 [Meristemomyces frigidus]